MNRPPPYFPQSQLTPPDPNRYRKFKAIVALVVVGILIVLGAVGFGIYKFVEALNAK